MQDLFQFLARYELIIYLVIGVGIVVALRRLIVSYGNRRTATFGLERRLASRTFNGSLTSVIALGLLGLTVFGIATFVAPARSSAFFRSTPTPDLLSTPQGALPPELATALAATPGAGSLPFGSQGCVPGRLVITFPAPGTDVGGI